MTVNPIISPKGLRSNHESVPAFWMNDILKIFNNYWTVQADAPWADSHLAMQ